MLASEILAPRDFSGQATGSECISPVVNVPTRLEKGEITETLLVPLMNQFGQMQQQMLDQFQQAISMIVQMFGTLHRDQMATIREELDQLRDLTREFHAIKLELAARSQDQTPVVPAIASTASSDPQISGVGSKVQERIESETDATVTPAAARTAPDVASVPPILSAGDGLGVASSSQAPLSPSGFERLEVKQAQPRSGESNLESDRDVIGLASSTNGGLAAGTRVAMAEDPQAPARPFLSAVESMARDYTSRETRKPPRAAPMEARLSWNCRDSRDQGLRA